MSLKDRLAEADRKMDGASLDRILADAARTTNTKSFEEGWNGAMSFARIAIVEDKEDPATFFRRHGEFRRPPEASRVSPTVEQERQDMIPDDPATTLPLAQPKHFIGNELKNRPMTLEELANEPKVRHALAKVKIAMEEAAAVIEGVPSRPIGVLHASLSFKAERSSILARLRAWLRK